MAKTFRDFSVVPKLVSTVFMCTGTLLSSPPGQIMKRVQFLREKHRHNKRTGKQTNKSSCNILISWELASQMRSEEHFFQTGHSERQRVQSRLSWIFFMLDRVVEYKKALLPYFTDREHKQNLTLLR